MADPKINFFLKKADGSQTRRAVTACYCWKKKQVFPEESKARQLE